MIGICASSLQQGTLKAAVVGIAAEFCLIFGSDMLRRLFVVHGMYGRFSSGTPLITNRFTLLGVMSLTLMGLLWLAYKNFLRAGAISRRIWSATSMALLIAVFLSVALFTCRSDGKSRIRGSGSEKRWLAQRPLQSENLARRANQGVARPNR